MVNIIDDKKRHKQQMTMISFRLPTLLPMPQNQRSPAGVLVVVVENRGGDTLEIDDDERRAEAGGGRQLVVDSSADDDFRWR